METVVDIHTHHERKEAIINKKPSLFCLEPGKYYSVGIHPWKLSDPEWTGDGKATLTEIEKETGLLEKAIACPQVLAIGEAGLDKLAKADMQLQEVVFRGQIGLAEKWQKPLIIHSVRTSNEIIRLKKEIRPSVPWIIHGFRGNKNIASQLLGEGLYLSFGEKYQAESMRLVPINFLFIETDESETEISQLYTRAAEVLSVSVEELTEKIRQNIRKVFFRQE